jgi:ATP-binding cassette subfamily C protein
MLIAKPVRALTQVLIMGSAAWLVLEYNRCPAIIFATSLLFGRAIAPVEGAISGWKGFAAALAAYRRLSGALPANNPVARAFFAGQFASLGHLNRHLELSRKR